jgi:hypothetical protein
MAYLTGRGVCITETLGQAVLELKGDECDIQNLAVTSDFGYHYESAIHWCE